MSLKILNLILLIIYIRHYIDKINLRNYYYQFLYHLKFICFSFSRTKSDSKHGRERNADPDVRQMRILPTNNATYHQRCCRTVSVLSRHRAIRPRRDRRHAVLSRVIYMSDFLYVLNKRDLIPSPLVDANAQRKKTRSRCKGQRYQRQNVGTHRFRDQSLTKRVRRHSRLRVNLIYETVSIIILIIQGQKSSAWFYGEYFSRLVS